MVSLTYANLQTLTYDTTITAATCEEIIDHAVDKINGYIGDDLLPNMTGTAGSKTLSVSSREAGFIKSLAVAIYKNDYRSMGAQNSSYGIGPLSVSQTGNPMVDVEALAKDAALHLKEIEVDTG